MPLARGEAGARWVPMVTCALEPSNCGEKGRKMA
jgi:hypothetical protein